LLLLDLSNSTIIIDMNPELPEDLSIFHQLHGVVVALRWVIGSGADALTAGMLLLMLLLEGTMFGSDQSMIGLLFSDGGGDGGRVDVVLGGGGVDDRCVEVDEGPGSEK
jgi:hypothetical protein